MDGSSWNLEEQDERKPSQSASKLVLLKNHLGEVVRGYGNDYEEMVTAYILTSPSSGASVCAVSLEAAHRSRDSTTFLS